MRERIRVVQLICGMAIGELNGGGELFAIRVAEALDPARFDVAICNLWAYDTPIERHWQRHLAGRGIPVFYGAPFRVQMRRDTALAFVGSYGHLRRLRPQIINTHTEFADLVGIALRLAGAGALMVRTGHNVIEWPFDRRIGRRMDILNPLVYTAEVGVSRAVAEMLDRRPAARALRARSRYIPNGVDAATVLAQRSQRDMRAVLGVAPDAPLFGVAARLSEQKGLPYLFQAMRLVREELPGARLLVAGKGELAGELAAMVADLGLADSITLLGPRSDAIDLIASLDVFVLSSLWEGLPTVIIEAMLLGTPVVATDVAGTRDLVLDGQTGLLAPPRDPRSLAAAMIRQYRDREQAQRMAAAAREHVTQFSMQRTVAEYAALYEELYERRRGGWRRDASD